MNCIRAIVSGKKKRYTGEGYDLDLSYITPRIIAMSIPGEGLTKLFRNNLNIVSEFLESHHRTHYQIYNLSGIPYAYDKFAEQVKEFPWPDHYPPPIELLFTACKSIESWLNESIMNVIAVNCRAGKGRTGTLICCYLLYSGLFYEVETVLRYYRLKRFKEGGGVTQPSQVRYVKYFGDILKGAFKSPLVLKPVNVQFRTSPHIKKKSCKPIIELYYNDCIVYSNKQSERGNHVHLTDEWESNRLHTVVVFNPIFIQGDILCRVVQWGKFRCTNICRFSFNTAFVPYNKVLVLRKYELDPYKFRKSQTCSDTFAVILNFEQICDCSSQMTVDERCEVCLKMLAEGEKEKWRRICEIVKERKILDPVENVFGMGEVDVDSVLKEFGNSFDWDMFEGFY